MENLQQSDLMLLNDNDKAELRRFINNETKRTQIQAQSHVLTDACWKRCVGDIRSSQLDKKEQGCMTNCVDRFLDVNMLTLKHLSSMRSQT